MCTGQREMLTRPSAHSCGSVSCLTCEPRLALLWREVKTLLGLGLSPDAVAARRLASKGPRALHGVRLALLKRPGSPAVPKPSKLVVV